MTTTTKIYKPEYPGGPIKAEYSPNLVLEYARTVPDAGKKYKEKKEPA